MCMDFIMCKGFLIFYLSDFYEPVFTFKTTIKTGSLHERKENIKNPGYRN